MTEYDEWFAWVDFWTDPECVTDRIRIGAALTEFFALVRIEAARNEGHNHTYMFAMRVGGVDGDHHRAWVIDQMVRILCGVALGENGAPAYMGNREWAENAEYRAWVSERCDGEDGPETYSWYTGIAP